MILFSFFFILQEVQGKCIGKFLNPITDVCWGCLFPITIGGFRVSPNGEDTPNKKQIFCTCSRPFPRIGLPITFWEPVRLVDVTRTPYCFVSMGGLCLSDIGYKSRGTVETKNSRGLKKSFYHVHWYIYPIFYWLELFLDLVCLEKAAFDVAYITELDPLWNDDETAIILNPEAALFGNVLAQAACSFDCIAATSGFSKNTMFWCLGCQGSLYPFTGSVSSHVGGVQASLLLVGRMMAKLHREFLLWGTYDEKALCDKYPMPIIQKHQYKNQMIYPIPQTKNGCHPLGRSEIIWGSGKEYPHNGEDFAYLIWRKRACCML